MNTKEEFEKAIQKELKPHSFGMDERAIALWAARWMAERCASLANHRMGTKDPAYAVACSDLKIMFRQYAKELQ
jgi:hypothetical protein